MHVDSPIFFGCLVQEDIREIFDFQYLIDVGQKTKNWGLDTQHGPL